MENVPKIAMFEVLSDQFDVIWLVRILLHDANKRNNIRMSKALENRNFSPDVLNVDSFGKFDVLDGDGGAEICGAMHAAELTSSDEILKPVVVAVINES